MVSYFTDFLSDQRMSFLRMKRHASKFSATTWFGFYKSAKEFS